MLKFGAYNIFLCDMVNFEKREVLKACDFELKSQKNWPGKQLVSRNSNICLSSKLKFGAHDISYVI